MIPKPIITIERKCEECSSGKIVTDMTGESRFREIDVDDCESCNGIGQQKIEIYALREFEEKKLRVLVACEESQEVCKAFRKLGHEAYSCDVIECSGGHLEWHIQDDVLNHLDDGWDLMIAHPPCTYLSVSGLHWNKKYSWRQNLTDKAMSFVRELMNAPIKRIALENPIGIISTLWRKPDQIIQPYEFGDNASKKTCLWLINLPKLISTKYVSPKIIEGKKRWSNQMDDGQNIVRNSDGKIVGWNTKEIKQLRSKTYTGIAQAMAEQWGTCYIIPKSLEPYEIKKVSEITDMIISTRNNPDGTVNSDDSNYNQEIRDMLKALDKHNLKEDDKVVMRKC